MEIATRTTDAVTVVELAGELDSRTSPDVQQRLDQLLSPRSSVLLDMRSLSYLSSAGLRVLLLTHRRAQAIDSRLALAGLDADVRAVMSATGFLEFFTVADTVPDGIAALKADPGLATRRSAAS